MAGVAPVSPRVKFTTAAGVPLVGGKLYVYAAGTTTARDTWQNQAQTVLNTNPITLDQNGEALVWIDAALSYKFLLKTAAGVTVSGYPVDNVSGWGNLNAMAASLTAYLAASTGSAGIGHDPGSPDLPNTTVRDALRRFEGADQMMGYISARMSAGETVNIACYGDSTVDGNDTTGWTANPTSGGEPVGGGAHVPPNGWTTKLEPILRAMFNNDNINVWNAGYSGQEMSDGWALENYDRAVTDNPAYGTPDICLIAFGLNDIDQTGSEFENHAIQTRLLVAKLIRAGTIPALMTCDAMARNDPSVRDNKESVRQIDQVKRSIAADYRIPLIEVGNALRDWLSVNRDGKRWATLQPDGLHGADVWNAFKAGAMARVFFPDVITVKPGDSFRVATMDSRSNNQGIWDQVSSSSNIAQGRNNFYSAAAPVLTTMQTLWVFNESADTEVIYRGLASERYSGTGMTNSPKTRITNMISGTAADRVPCGVGFFSDGTSPTYAKSDLPYRLGHLDYGLNKIEYISGDSANDLFYANFEFWQTPKELGLGALARTNALKHTSVFQQTFSATGIQSVLFPEFRDGSNVYGLMSADTVEILIDVTMPQGAGFIFANCQTWSGSAVFGDRAFAMLFRQTDNDVSMHGGTVIGGVTTYLGDVGATASPVVWTSNRATLRLVINRVGDEQKLNLYATRSGGSPILTVTRALSTTSLPWAGAVGGFLWDGPVAGAGYAIAHEVSIRRY